MEQEQQQQQHEHIDSNNRTRSRKNKKIEVTTNYTSISGGKKENFQVNKRIERREGYV